MLYAYGWLTFRQKLGEDSLVVIEVIDKPLLHQLNIAIKKREKSGGCQLGQNLGKKSGGF